MVFKAKDKKIFEIRRNISKKNDDKLWFAINYKKRHKRF